MKPNKNKDKAYEEEDDGSGEGASGEIEFRYHDAASTEQRDDLLSPAELKRLLTVHKDVHKERVDKQKRTRQERLLKKEGPTQLVTRSDYKAGMSAGGGSYSKYKTHPIAIKFAGIRDLQITAIPSENTAETNKELQNELQNRLENKLENKLQLKNQPSFTPKPRPY